MSTLVIKQSTSAVDLATMIADLLAHSIVGALSVRGIAHVALTGGRIGTAVLGALGQHPLTKEIPWDGVHLWWSDERFLTHADPDRNYVGAASELLGSLVIPTENVHEMPSSDAGSTVVEAASEYWDEIVAAFDDSESVQFDLCLLGVGEDGHVASLFPQHQQIEDDRVTVISVTDSPKPPSTRLTFTRELICRSRQVWLLASGTAKADAVRLIVDPGGQPVPAARVHGLHRTILFVDQDAAVNLASDEPDEDWLYEE
jgi:6-phosphogluconolactonase